MSKNHVLMDEKKRISKSNPKEPAKPEFDEVTPKTSGLKSLQHQVGNRTVQRLLAQRSGDGSFELDDEAAGRINHQRGGGQPLDSAVQEQMGEAMGQDFSGVQVHTSRESDELNQQIGAKAFTTGQDIFFQEGAYEPNTDSGQELIAHELTHVVQQGSGALGSGGRMTVNAPGDAFEQEADSVAKEVTSPQSSTEVQRQEEEEEVQMQPLEEEEEMMQAKHLQRQEEEEEEVMAKHLQRQEEEEELAQMQPLEEEEEELLTKRDE